MSLSLALLWYMNGLRGEHFFEYLKEDGFSFIRLAARSEWRSSLRVGRRRTPSCCGRSMSGRHRCCRPRRPDADRDALIRRRSFSFYFFFFGFVIANRCLTDYPNKTSNNNNNTINNNNKCVCLCVCVHTHTHSVQMSRQQMQHYIRNAASVRMRRRCITARVSQLFVCKQKNVVLLNLQNSTNLNNNNKNGFVLFFFSIEPCPTRLVYLY